VQELATVNSTGASVTYDDGVFAIAGATVGIEKIMEYDGLGVLAWVNEETHMWAQQLATPGVASPPPVPSSQAVGDAPKAKKPLYKKWWVWVLGILVLAAIVNAASGGSKPAPTATPSQSAAAPTAPAPAAPEATTAPAPPAPEANPAPTPAPAATTYSDGTYLVGTDIPAGRYKGTPSGGTAYWGINTDANGDNTIANNNTDGQFYVTVKNGQYLEIVRAEIAKFTPESAVMSNSVSDGTYLVGTDIPAGRYKGTPSGGTAYWGINKDANGDNTIANNNTDGQFYVTVKNGQYLEIVRAEITKVK